MKIRPLGDRILVRRIKEEEKTKGGIIIPDTAKEKPQEGKVVAVGKGKANEKDGKLIPLEVKAGDKILFGKYSGSEIKLEGEEHLILREDDIRESWSSSPRQQRIDNQNLNSGEANQHACENSPFFPGSAREDPERGQRARRCGDCHARSQGA